MKVLSNFYCTKEKKSYKVGQDYTGSRTDLGGLVEVKKKQTRKKKKDEA